MWHSFCKAAGPLILIGLAIIVTNIMNKGGELATWLDDKDLGLLPNFLVTAAVIAVFVLAVASVVFCFKKNR